MIDLPNMVRKFKNDETAVSELIGYAFVFSAVIATVVFVLLAAGPIIDNVQNQEATVSMENNFVQIDKQVQKVQDGSDAQIFQTELPAGQFRQEGYTTMEFEQEQTGDSITVESRPLLYETEHGGAVLYEAGFIALAPKDTPSEWTHIRHQSPDSHMDRNPVFKFPAMDHPSSVAGYSTTRSTNVHFTIEQESRETQQNSEVFRGYDDNGDPLPVEVTVTTEIPGAWEMYLENHAAFQVESVDYETGEITAVINFEENDELHGDRFTVTSQDILIDFES